MPRIEGSKVRPLSPAPIAKAGTARRKAVPPWLKGCFFASPWLIGLLWFYVGPFAASLYLSFHDATALGTTRFVGLANYRRLTGDALFWKSLQNTFSFTLAAVGLGNALALTLALLSARVARALSGLRAIFYLPCIVPFSASSVIWIWVLHPQYGLLNRLLGSLHLPRPGWLSDPSWSLPALVLVSLWTVGSMMLVYLAAILDLPRELEEAARLDGASTGARLRCITLPLLSPVILFNVLVGLIQGFQYFVQPYVMTQGGPADSTLVYALYLYKNAFEYFRMGYASAMAWVLLLIVLALSLLVLRTSRRWVHYRS